MNTVAVSAGILAQSPAKGPGLVPTLLLWGGVFLIFYLFFILPQVRRQRKEKEFRNTLQKGQRVATLSGIHGRVVAVEDTSVLLEVDEGVKLRVDKVAIGRSLDTPAESAKK